MTEDSVTTDDTGKPIVDADGDQIGIIADVSGDNISVEPDPDVTEDVRATLGWGDATDEYQLPADASERNPQADVAVFEIAPDELDRA